MAKIVFITPSYQPKIGGVESHVQAVTQELAKLGHQVLVVTAGDKFGYSKSRNVFTINTRLQSKYEIWLQIWQLRREFRTADIVHAHAVAWWLVPVLPLILHKFNITFYARKEPQSVTWQAKLNQLIFALLARSSVHVDAEMQQYYWDLPDEVISDSANEITNKYLKLWHLDIS